MAEKDQSHKLSIIKTAMLRAGGKKGEAAHASIAAEKSEGLSVQFNQGEAFSPQSRQRRPLPGNEAPGASVAIQEAKQGLINAIRALSSHGLLVTSHFISAAAGAALMWYVMDKPALVPQAAMPQDAVRLAELPSTAKESQALPEAGASMEPVDTQVRDLLERWRRAWSSRDVDAYLAFYSASFVPANGMQRPAWAESRRKNFLGRSSISVQLHELKVIPVDDRQVKVTLRQDYVSDRYTELGQPKNFLLTREGKDWRIVREWQGG